MESDRGSERQPTHLEVSRLTDHGAVLCEDPLDLDYDIYEMISTETKDEVKSLIKKLNHRAKIIESCRGKVSVAEIVNTGLFKLDVAQSGYGWLQDLHAMTVREVNGRNVVTPKPETEEYNVQSFIYTRYRPFHPQRLFALIYDKFILQMEHPDEDEEDEEGVMDEQTRDSVGSHQDNMDVDMETTGTFHRPESRSGSDRRDSASERSDKSSASTVQTIPSPGCEAKQAEDMAAMQLDLDMDMPPNEDILANKRGHPIFKRLFRSKGEYFLATRPHRAGEWSQAGAMLTLTGGRAWFCTLSPEEYVTGDEEIDALVRHDMAKGGEWGDRRQELVFIGEKLNHAQLATLLDACLLTDEEMERWTEIMRDAKLDTWGRIDALQEIFDDGFPDWVEEEGEEEGEEEEEGGEGEEEEGEKEKEMEGEKEKRRGHGHEGHAHSRGRKHNVAGNKANAAS
ncbi:hypothetical protein E4U43_007232 [Claviceps pusilla]|uniref:CobW C-terminal domain-containing protein n=1 Tax=Claviceps pusilla TaxID=123648 RepID=A0A9P7NF23_9HYPO|nr:hypothetical protein E4U43_007232 [Claviceps pusilla]